MHVLIGDFAWTGWDYVAEVGIGGVDYTEEDYTRQASPPPTPDLLTRAGDIDITGHRRPTPHYREIVYGLRHEPYLAVHRQQHHVQAPKTPLTSPERRTQTMPRWPLSHR